MNDKVFGTLFTLHLHLHSTLVAFIQLNENIKLRELLFLFF